MAEEYSRPFTVVLQGQPLAEISQITTKTTSNDKGVMTLSQGLAGFSNGAKQAEISGKGAIPLEGFEVDFADFCLQHVTKQFTIREANKAVTVRGRFMEVTSTSSVDQPNEVDFNFTGKVISRRGV